MSTFNLLIIFNKFLIAFLIYSISCIESSYKFYSLLMLLNTINYKKITTFRLNEI